ncbi:MAG: RNA-binding protein [Prochloraceae cyanobacterium]|nr:RNA-binding protein [Prochloraceae cyanobacterium]
MSYAIITEDLQEVFGDYGTVKKISLPIDRETGRTRGFAFVEMSSEAEELKAIEALNKATWMGRTMKVNVARPREPRS